MFYLVICRMMTMINVTKIIAILVSARSLNFYGLTDVTHERRGDEGSAHRVRRVAAIKAELAGVFAISRLSYSSQNGLVGNLRILSSVDCF
jgi:hypothetical protein